MTALKAGDGATATLLAFAALSRHNTWVSGLGRFTVPQPHLEDGSVYRQNRPTKLDSNFIIQESPTRHTTLIEVEGSRSLMWVI